MSHYQAILLLGPTGSGKTPLGMVCEPRGLWGRRCVHFDFGEALRKAADAPMQPALLTDEDMAVVTQAIESGALLENENFHIARNILVSFARERGLNPDDLLLLNGLPRHVGQADDVATIVDVKLVVCLDCAPEVAAERIRLNSAGDRHGRVDDSPDAVEDKLAIFYERTLPLLRYYRARGTEIERVSIEAHTAPEDIWEQLNSKEYVGLARTRPET